MKPPFLIALLAALLLAPAAAGAQQRATLALTVLELGSARPLPAVLVTLPGTGLSAQTDAEGRATLVVPPGTHAVVLERIGYRQATFSAMVSAGGRAEVDVEMAAEPVVVQPVTVTAPAPDAGLDRTGFYQRRRSGRGVFVTREELDEWRPARLGDVFRGRVQGARMVRIQDPGSRQTHESVASTRSPIHLSPQTGRFCLMEVLVDGQVVQAGTLGTMSPDDVVALEVYRGPAEIPAEFNSTGSACGVILVWTRVTA